MTLLDYNLVVGLDHNAKSFHWVSTAPVRFTGEFEHDVDYGWAHAKDSNPDIRRLGLLRDAESLFSCLERTGKEGHLAVHVFAEEPLALQNGKTTRLLALAAGAIWAAHTSFSMWWHWVDVASWKKDVVGKGNASKDDVREFCLNNTAFNNERRSFDDEPDLYDAWCLRAHGVRSLVRSRGGTA